jgi:sigma-B regulation protein RsbU (phosphoserine phosphatase)
MENSPSGEAIGSQGIFRTLLELNEAEETPEYIGEFYTLQNYRSLIIEETETFVERMNTLNDNIQQQADRYIRNSTRIALGMIALTLLITTIITLIFSRRMGRRIKLVESAIRDVSRGDFSNELDIRSGDEFEELSHNYNTLKNQLREKLDSVLDFMLNISTSLTEGPNLKRILDQIAEAAIENTDADGAAVYLITPDGTTLQPRSFSGSFVPPFPVEEEYKESEETIAEAKKKSIHLGEYLVGKATQNAEPQFIRSAGNDGQLDVQRTPEDPLYIESLIVSPLTISNRILGTIVITKNDPQERFTDLDFTHMRTFADYAALTIDNIFNYEELIEKREMHREIEIAANIQQGLLPGQIPDLRSVDITAFSQAARGISGDYYDIFTIQKGTLGVVICDVVGKGVPASLLMVMIRTIVRLISTPQRDPAQLLTFLNRGIIGRIGTDHFATLSFLRYDEEKREITYSNAAHPPMLIYRSEEDQFVEIDTPGLPIGVEEKERYQQRTLTLEPNDIVILITDGIPESRSEDGREYSLESLKDLIKRSKDKNAKTIQSLIQKDLERFVGDSEQHDDQTLVLLKMKE